MSPHPHTSQSEHWSSVVSPERFARDSKVSALVFEVLPYVPRGGRVVEVGCGAGWDTALLAEAVGEEGEVWAVDVNPAFLDMAVERSAGAGRGRVRPLEQDLNLELSLEGEVDVVHAHLSLHYFSDERTREIFSTLHEALREGGVLGVVCKSTRDPLYGKGREVGVDTFEEEGHLRHFFSEAYLSDLLSGWTVIRMEESERELYGKPSVVVSALAQK